ncbi:MULTISPECIES: hypothetical protein [Rhodobacterales]|uniref:hypothetical protein n=1 Tax=Roseobacter sp. N2S TaxID=2663844 RepID=UPI00285CBE27|nr:MULTISPECIES: hypothetical protein [Rhodobacterales]MDR6266747.1 hypothetical protein [Roseobacter sp. N2S]
MIGNGIVDAVFLVLLVTLGVYVFRLNRKIDQLRTALLEVGPSLQAYEGAITTHKESMSSFSESLGPLQTLTALSEVSAPDDGGAEFDAKARVDGEISGGVEGETTDDLSRVFYGTFGKEVK